MAGVTSEGFVAKTVDEIVTELEDAFRSAFGQSIDVSPQSNFGQLIGVMAERYADLWALGSAVYAAFNPDAASGASLDYVCALTGTVREPARRSEVSLTATGTPGTVLALERGVSVVSTGVQFRTVEEQTIAAVAAWASGTVYAAGARRTNGGNVYQCTTGGTSAGSGGPTGTGSAIADNTAVWKYLGAGTGAIDVLAESADTGPKVAVADTLTVIDTPVAGWSNVTNLLDADLGADVETDAALRLRRETELRVSGKAALEAIREDLLAVEGVTAALVFENVTDVTDGDGIPPHAVEALVLGGDDAEVAAALFDSVAAGIRTFGQGTGAVSETVTDSQGFDHTIEFSRPEELNVYVRVDAITDSDSFPADGADQIKAAIVEFGDAQPIGKNVVAASVGAQAFKVDGVLDTPIVYIGLVNPAVASTTIAVSLRQLAKFDTSRITVNVSTGVP